MVYTCSYQLAGYDCMQNISQGRINHYHDYQHANLVETPLPIKFCQLSLRSCFLARWPHISDQTKPALH